MVHWRILGNMADNVLGLLRFGSQRRIQEFQRGLLYMNPIEYFRRLEGDSQRADANEGTSHMWQGRDGRLQVKINGAFTPIGGIISPLRFRSDSNMKVNVFCMFALRGDQSGAFIDSRIRDVGDTFALVTDHREFLNRVTNAVAKLGQQIQHHLVEYVDENTYEGQMGVFFGRILHSHTRANSESQLCRATVRRFHSK